MRTLAIASIHLGAGPEKIAHQFCRAESGSVVQCGDLEPIERRTAAERYKDSDPDQSNQVLAMLLEHSGEVVARGELYERLWPNGIIVEFEQGMNSVINLLLSSSRAHARTDPSPCCPLRV